MAALMKNLLNAKEALNGIDFGDILFEMDDETKSELQNVLLEMYQDLLEVCKRYQITPYLIGGSALGAVRHKGFIPWDDDIDIGMTREDYQIFLKIFGREFSDKYRLNAPNCVPNAKARFAKMIKKGTVFKEITDGKDESLCGIFLDIFVIENVPRNLILRKFKGICCNALQFISSQVYLVQNTDETVKEIYSRSGAGSYKVRMLVGKVFSFIKPSYWFNAVDHAARYRKKTGLYGVVTGRKHYFGEIFEEDVLFPVQYVDFCGIKAPVFHNIDAYLSNLYGDYMWIPPMEKRERHFIKEIKFNKGDSQ